ncbi:MAG: sigma factor-like helix-turn-helix DNA-binding protein [Candidatus Paceibacteria bacterium]
MTIVNYLLEVAAPELSPEDHCVRKDTEGRIRDVIDEYLTPKEKLVLHLRYECEGTRPDIAEDIGMRAPHRVRTLEEGALEKLRERFEELDYKFPDFQIVL